MATTNYLLLATNILLAILISFVSPEVRYSLTVWALAVLHVSAVVYGCLVMAAIKLRRGRG